MKKVLFLCLLIVVISGTNALSYTVDISQLHNNDSNGIAILLGHSVAIYPIIGNHEANCYNQNYDGGKIFAMGIKQDKGLKAIFSFEKGGYGN